MEKKAHSRPRKHFKELPTTFRNYIFKKEIGSGGFSRVYLIESEHTHTEYVAKVISFETNDSQKYEASFDAEIAALMDLNHPNIIQLYDHFVENDLFVIVLEYCPCGNLADEVKRKGMTLERFVFVAKQIISALQYCHSRNIAHHDIKLQNILMDRVGRPKLADFGLSSRTCEGEVSMIFKGSMLYTAPEIYQKKAYDPFKADIWALGVLFVYMYSGYPPWPKAHGMETMRKMICHGDYASRRRLPPGFAQLIRTMIVVNPDRRISMTSLQNSTMFREQMSSLGSGIVLSPRGTDALSPRARTRDRILGGSMDELAQFNVSPRSQRQDSDGPTCVDTKALAIYRANCLHGLSFCRLIKPRLHRKNFLTP